MILYILSFFINIFLIFPVVDIIYTITEFDLSYIMKLLTFINVEPNITLALLVISAAFLLLCTIFSALPPLQALLMWLNGGKSPAEYDKEKLAEIIAILETASQKDLSNIKFYIDENAPINAYALGRNRIAIGTEILRSFHPQEAAAILAHELGHLQLHHTSFGLAVYMMNTISYKLFFIYYLVLHVACAILSVLPFMGWAFVIMQYILKLFVYIVTKIIEFPYYFVYLFIGRRNEYAADAYAGKLGLAQPLASALYKIEASQNFGNMSHSFFQGLSQTHPPSKKRIEKLMKIDEEMELAKIKSQI